MNSDIKTKVLVIGIVKDGDKILMRKKPDGSPPYKETWYLFGGELKPSMTVNQAIIDEVKAKAGIEISVTQQLSWDTEVKRDLDGEVKQFIYLDTICKYEGGDLTPSHDIERLEWVPVSKLDEYDIVPPSKILFNKLGYYNS
ncbi:NUDIX domain-containing protein [Candidatus Saccharibacteria bacterium]|nr:NUDIX domain-containing protein [Candidatus Saccharibacteria bacterium]